MTHVLASVGITCISLFALSTRSRAPTIRPRPRHPTHPRGEPRTPAILQTPSSRHKPPCRSHDLYASSTSTARTRAKSDTYRERVPRRCERSKVERMTDLFVLLSPLPARLFVFCFPFVFLSFALLALHYHSCIPHHVMIDLFIFQRLYIHPHLPCHNTIRCILSSYLLFSSIRSYSRASGLYVIA